MGRRPPKLNLSLRLCQNEPRVEAISRLFQTSEGPVWQTVVAIADVLLVTYLLYRGLLLLRGARAWRVALGVGFFALALFLSDVFFLVTLHWILEKAAVLMPVALVIMFLPELRQAIEDFGKIGGLGTKFFGGKTSIRNQTIIELCVALEAMSSENTGALIVIQRGRPLDEVIANGVQLNATVSAQLLCAIFHDGNPLHDGAAIIRNNRIVAAACQLPMSGKKLRQGHMRHSAGLGITEETDSIALIVSEERGTVGMAVEGEFRVFRSVDELGKALEAELEGATAAAPRGASA